MPLNPDKEALAAAKAMVKGGMSFCTACGHPNHPIRHTTRMGAKSVDGAGYAVLACHRCGHLMHWRNGAVRCLTQDEKQRLPDHWKATAIRECQEQIVSKLIG